MLKVNCLSLSKSNKEILKEISIEIPPGRTTLLLGKSGSGKTTLLRCLCQLETKYTGNILYQSGPIENLSRKSRAQLFGFLPQSFVLFPHMTVLSNCAQPMQKLFNTTWKEAEEKALQLLAKLDMESFAKSFPHELSGGQQQRVAIARALGLDPQFLFLDEPTSALDPENTILLIQIMQMLIKENKGIVVSSQDMGFASKALDRAFFLEQGTIVESFDAKNSHLESGSYIHRFLL